MFMLTIAAALIAQTGWDDRAKFEQSWATTASKDRGDLSKDQAWRIWVWTDVQFVAGFCSDFIPASTLATILHLPDEDELMKSAGGARMMKRARDTFRSGMDYRKEVTPTPKLCERQMENSTRLLQSTAP